MANSPVPLKKKKTKAARALVKTKRRKMKRGRPRISALELAERRQEALTMRLQGMTFKEIGEKLKIGYMTVKKDLDIIRQENLDQVTTFNRDEAVAQAMHTYDQVEYEAWKQYHSATKSKDKFLNLVRVNNRDRIQLLVDIGLVSKAALKVEHKLETDNALSNWTEDAKAIVSLAILRAQMEGKERLQLPEGGGNGRSQVIEVAAEPVEEEEAV